MVIGPGEGQSKGTVGGAVLYCNCNSGGVSKFRGFMALAGLFVLCPVFFHSRPLLMYAPNYASGVHRSSSSTSRAYQNPYPNQTGHSYSTPPHNADPQLWQWFTAVDTDRSGSISVAELQAALVNGKRRFPMSSLNVG
jgi:hypothetical protein